MLLDENGIGPGEPERKKGDPEAEVDAHLAIIRPVTSGAEAMAHLLAGAEALGLDVLISESDQDAPPTVALFTDPERLRVLRENITEYLEELGEGFEPPAPWKG